MREIYKNVPVIDTGARGSTVTLVERNLGDVLIACENETDQWSAGVTGKNLADHSYFLPYASGSGYVMPGDGRMVLAFAKLRY